MTIQQRLRSLEKMIYDPKTCPNCNGTGVMIGREKWKRNKGCARCFVRVGRVILSDTDLRWLIKKAKDTLN